MGGIPELIGPGQSGLLFEPDNISQLRDGLIRLLEDREFAISLAERLHDVVAERFTWRHTAAIYQRLYALRP